MRVLTKYYLVYYFSYSRQTSSTLVWML